jgi:uncharacterized protein (DUF1800 family)
MAKLDGYYTFTHPETGISETFGPGDDLPDWVDTSPKHVGTGEPDEVDQDADDYEVAGPGMHDGEAARLEEEAKAEARRAADRERKAKQRAAKTSTDAQVKAAAEAEQKRKDEEAAAAEAAAQGGGK